MILSPWRPGNLGVSCWEHKVFSSDIIDTWIDLKRDSATQVALRRHPYMFYRYSDS